MRRPRRHARVARRAGRRSGGAAARQPAAAAERRPRPCAATARALGYESLNFDLIYGLPGQTVASMARLTEAVLDLRPDRLAVYSFARVPWIKPAQRRFKDDQIPAGADKRALYDAVRDPLLDAGYEEIGLDHFALPADALARAAAARHAAPQFHGLHARAHVGADRPGRERDFRDRRLLSPERKSPDQVRAPGAGPRDSDAAGTRAVARAIATGAGASSS